MNIPYVAEKVKLSHVAEIVKLSHVAGILEAGSMYDQYNPEHAYLDSAKEKRIFHKLDDFCLKTKKKKNIPSKLNVPKVTFFTSKDGSKHKSNAIIM